MFRQASVRAQPRGVRVRADRPARGSSPILDEVPTCAFDVAGGDRQAYDESAVVVEPGGVPRQVLDALLDGLGGLGGQVVALDHVPRMLVPGAAAECPVSSACSRFSTHVSASPVPDGIIRYVRGFEKGDVDGDVKQMKEQIAKLVK